MRQTFALLAAAVILLLTVKPVIAAPGIGDRLSLSLTNKYGDVLANPTVTQILADGLVLQRGTMAMKVKYQDLPPDISQKYQALAAGVIRKEVKQGVANAYYLAYTGELQAEQEDHQVAQETQENQDAQARAQSQSAPTNQYVIIPIPNQRWNIGFINLGFSNWDKKRDASNQYVVHGLPGPLGFDLVLFVTAPANNLAGNDAVYNFYWSNMAHDSLIDPQSVKFERKDKFIKVSYSAQGQPNVNYFFACEGNWVDLHLAKRSLEPGDDKLFDRFDSSLSYGE
ncbi:MAG TPA: hypothetical protein VMJ12_07475 [Candidatus Acidoferrales bacterium]|nr:hypothetical protein [Candidatus Acidoferrales bacterium]